MGKAQLLQPEGATAHAFQPLPRVEREGRPSEWPAEPGQTAECFSSAGCAFLSSELAWAALRSLETYLGALQTPYQKGMKSHELGFPVFWD